MTAERFPIANPKFVRLLGWACLVGWVVAVAMWIVACLSAGGIREALQQQSTPVLSGANPLVYLTILVFGASIVWMAFLKGTRTALVLAQDGISLERQGRTLWRLGWEDYDGWLWENDQPGRLFALVLLHRAGDHRRVKLGMYSHYRYRPGLAYTPLLAALQRRAPDQGEHPTAVVHVSERSDWPLYLIALIVLLGFMAVVLLHNKIINWGIP